MSRAYLDVVRVELDRGRSVSDGISVSFKLDVALESHKVSLTTNAKSMLIDCAHT